MTNAELIRPYRIEIPQTDIDDLHDRLARTRWFDDLPGVEWNRGVPTSYLKGLTEVERERQWPARSAKLMLRTALAALDRHYAMPNRRANHL